MRTTMIYKHILIAITLAIISTSVLADKKIPMIDKKYNGKYFLISNKKKGGINLVIYKYSSLNKQTPDEAYYKAIKTFNLTA